ncbi:hypothetical protein ACSBR2_017612 [Camellia fascicularis]
MSRGTNYGWDDTSNDYHSHVSRMERMPSVLTDVPHYPNVHRIFNNTTTVYEEEDGSGHNQKKHHEPQVRAKKVQFVEHEEVIGETDKNGNNVKVYKENVDVEADGFIKQKHKNFELCKWATFKMT